MAGIDVVQIGQIFSSILMIMAMTFVFKHTVISKIVINLFVGLTVGYGLVIAVNNIVYRGVLLIPSSPINVLWLIVGALILTRFSKKLSHFSRWPVAVLIGIGTAVSLRGSIGASLLNQITATALPIIPSDPLASFNNLVIIIGTLSVLVFFFFTIRPSRAQTAFGSLGRYMLMIAFGFMASNLLFSYVTLLIGAMQIIVKTLGIA